MFREKVLLYKCLRVLLVGLTLGFVGCSHRTVIDTVDTVVVPARRLNLNLPQVVVTTSLLCDLTKQVAEDNINLVCLIPPGVEPSLYRVTDKDVQSLEEANLILYQGYNSEARLIKAIRAMKTHGPKIAVSQLAVPHPQKLQIGKRKVVEPYIWHNAKNTVKMVQVISKYLSKLTPEKSKIYRQNSRRAIAQLNQLDKWIKSRIASIPQNNRRLFTAHDNMKYYVMAYGLNYRGNLVTGHSIRNSNNLRLTNLVKEIHQKNISVIFTDTNTNPNLLEPLAREAKVKIFPRPLYVSGLGVAGSDAETYQKMMDNNTRNIVEGLGGTYLQFQPSP